MIGHRTQPYRSGQPRVPGLALAMMLRGRQPGPPLDYATMLRLQRQAAPNGNLEQLIARHLQRLFTAPPS